MSQGRRGGRGGGHEEEHENHERWLVTYADMVTLLMVLFIVMFAMSQVDQNKYQELRSGLAAGFGASDSILGGSVSVLDQPGNATIESLTPGQFNEDMSVRERGLVVDAVHRASAQQQQRRYAEAVAEAKELDDLAREIMRALRRRGLLGDVRPTIDERGLVLSLVSRHVVFRANIADLSPRGRKVVDTLAPVLRRLEEPLEVAGHTNQVPVKPKYYATDWDLSSARAITVLRRLSEQWSISQERLRASAFGSEKPLIDPDRPGSQAINKRVDIVVLSGLAPESRALLETAVRDARRQVGVVPAAGPVPRRTTDQTTEQTPDRTTEQAPTDRATHAEGAR